MRVFFATFVHLPAETHPQNNLPIEFAISMVEKLLFPLTLSSTLGSGMIAGLLFVFSNFMMKVLARMSPENGISTMQAINTAIVNPLFLLIFLGSALACVANVIYCFMHWNQPGISFLLAGSAMYLIGTFGVTIAFNVPLNDTLASIDASNPSSVQVWKDYLAAWTVWNHVRTIAAIIATGLLTMAVYQLRSIK